MIATDTQPTHPTHTPTLLIAEQMTAQLGIFPQNIQMDYVKVDSTLFCPAPDKY